MTYPGLGTLLPHPNECCELGVDEIAEGRTFVFHENAGRRWGCTILHDREGSVVNRWGEPPGGW